MRHDIEIKISVLREEIEIYYNNDLILIIKNIARDLLFNYKKAHQHIMAEYTDLLEYIISIKREEEDYARKGKTGRKASSTNGNNGM